MAKCKLCKANIPDGTEYCKECLAKNNSKLNESYLDSLLNSVINTVPSNGNTFKKNENADHVEIIKHPENKPIYADSDISDKLPDPKPSVNSNKKSQDSDTIITNADVNEDSFEIDFKDLEDFEELDINSDLEDNIIISDEELFGKDFEKLISGNEEKQPIKQSGTANMEQEAVSSIQPVDRQKTENNFDLSAEDSLELARQ
jgi:hypothetical protein